jgi:hypothetical protein
LGFYLKDSSLVIPILNFLNSLKMDGNKKVLSGQLSNLILPKLTGLTEKNAKKVLEAVEKSVGEIAKKYAKLIAEQDKEAARAKAKAAKIKQKLADKEAKKKKKLAKKAAELKQVSQLMRKETVAVAPKVVSKSPAKPVAKPTTKVIKK